jgi:hypothetical protein
VGIINPIIFTLKGKDGIMGVGKGVGKNAFSLPI